MRIEVTVKNDKGRVISEWYAHHVPSTAALTITALDNGIVTDSQSNIYHRIPEHARAREMRIHFEHAEDCLKSGNPAPLLNTLDTIIQWIEEYEKRMQWTRDDGR